MMLEKIKQFFANMTSKQKYGVIGGAAAVVVVIVAIIVIALTGGNHEQPSGTTTVGGDEKVTYTIEVKTEGGRELSDVSVFFYEDSTLAELVTIGETDAEGKLSFTDAAKDTYVAVLKDLPEGYQVEASYALTGEVTEIVIPTAVIEETGLDGVTYKVGDVIRDFTVTAPNGTAYRLSDLLKEKKAVVLNFWYTKCDPCKQEFPHLQAAYENYSDEIELLAIDPVAVDDDAAVSAFQTDMGLTFPMAKGDTKWEDAFSLVYPTTVVVDRYGVITMIHRGTVPNTETFENLFETIAADDYVQTLYESMTAFAPADSTEGTTEESTEESTEAVGSESNPIELGGVSEFEAEVKAGEKVYYHLYRVNDMIFTLEDKDAYVIFGGETYQPADGVISFTLTTEDMNTPASVVIGNSGSADKTFKVTLAVKEGTFNNPYPLEMGELLTDLEAGNEQGVYYLYSATERGTVTIKNISTTEGAVHGYVLYNLTTYAQRTLDESSDGSVSIEVNEGDQLMVTVAVMPNEENEYPAATIVSEVGFEKSAGATEGNTEGTTAGENATTEAPTKEPATEAPTQKPTEAPTEDPTQAPTQGSTEAAKVTYTVVVKNSSGRKISGVKLTLNGKTYTTNSYGEVNAELVPATYTVKVTSVPSGYNKPVTTYQLTSSRRNVTITLSNQSTPTTEAPTEEPTTEATQGTTQRPTQTPTTQAPTTQAPTTQEPTTEAPTEEPTEAPTVYNPNSMDAVYGDTAVNVTVGSNQLTLTPGTINYFVFGTSQEGKYQFSINNSSITIGEAGTTAYVLYQLSSTNVSGNVLTVSIKQSYIDNNGPAHVIGLNVPAGVTGCTLMISRVGSADKTIEDLPEEIYKAKTPPTKFTSTETGTLTYVDLSSTSTAVLGTDGKYHLNSATGSVLYVNLGVNAPYISYQTLLGYGPVREYIKQNGTYVKKIEYTDCMNEYVSCIDSKLGIYPLTEDLMYIIQRHGAASGWWAVGENTYIFNDVSNLNVDTAWMFACCYFK